MNMKNTVKLGMASLATLALASSATAQQPCRRRVWVPSVYETQPHKVIVLARHRTITEKVWVEPAYQWRQKKVWVPTGGRSLKLQLGTKKFSLGLNLGGSPRRGYYKMVRQRVCIKPGHLKTIRRRILVQPQRTKTVYKKVLVRPGYWR